MRLLVVEDERDIANDIAIHLGAAGFRVEVCNNGEDAWFLGSTEDFDGVVLDLGLPKLDGLSVLRKWRREGRDMPVIVLTSRDSWTEKVDGINSGADDYLTKPFSMDELIARMRAVLRRSFGHSSAMLSAGGLLLDTSQMRVSVEGRSIHLTPLEYRLVSYLLHNRGRVVPGPELREHVYGNDDSREANAVEALVSRLRRKLGTQTIETRRGHGYLIGAEV
jgi:two-component system, OmpR family, response regulator